MGLRERKKAETRRHLADVALALFEERGFDAVTLADVASAAGVSEKTVSNYFHAKEDLALVGREEVEQGLIRAIVQRGPGQSILTATRGYAVDAARQMASMPAKRREAFSRLVRSTPAIHNRMRSMALRYEDELTGIIATQTQAGADDPVPRLVAGILGSLCRLAFGSIGWPGDGVRSPRQIEEGIESAFNQIGVGLGEYGKDRDGPGPR